MKDVESGIISHRAARDVYRVAYDREMLVADEEKTKALREQERADRKKRGKKYAEFEEGWLKQKPSPEALQFYGEWPITHYKSFTYYGPWPGENE
jgi:acetophenone carboxylase